MVFVLLLAAVLRLWMLPAYPLGLHYDEAANVILTRQIAEGGYRPLFIRAYTGKEVLFFYTAAPWMVITGGQAWSVRLGAAMLGILTVATTFTMTRALVRGKRSQRIALCTAAWMAIAFPHVLLSRYGFRAIAQPLLQALAVTAIWRGLRSQKAVWLVAGGALLGLTGYTYLAARLFPIPIAVAMGAMWLQTPRQKRTQTWRAFALIFISAVISFAPLGTFFLINPETFGTRIAQVASPSVSEALQGIWLCLKALLLPGQGDAYVRFNQPGRPVLDGLAAWLACVGLVVFVRAKVSGIFSRAGRVLILTALVVMLLPSALATAEITPSHLRMVGVFPFLALLPALGLSWLADIVPGKRFHGIAGFCLFLILGASTGKAYALWSQSMALFTASDGEMVLAAQAVDEEAAEGTTVYVSSRHYRHPTVAALAYHYNEVKWITGGASFVLPSEGDSVAIVPRSQRPPSAWPAVITQYTSERWLADPDGAPAVSVQHLAAGDIATLRQAGTLLPHAEPAVDFAHIVGVYDISPAVICEIGRSCTIALTWQALAPTTALQPLVRLVHPVTGEWSRAMPFHYPAEQWTPGDLVLDQIQLEIPAGMPPGDGYQLAVSMVDTDNQSLLPRLVQEQFAGLEVRVPASETLPWPAPLRSPLTEAEINNACAGVPREKPLDLAALRLLGWLLPTKPGLKDNAQVKPGELLPVTLCWEVLEDADAYKQVELRLRSADDTVVLYTGTPASGYGFEAWLPGTLVEDRYAPRLPREMKAGSYNLQVSIDDDLEPIDLVQLEVVSVTRTFTLPEVDVTIDAVFDGAIRLWGYDLDVQPSGEGAELTLYWQSIKSIEQDFVVFIHVVDPISGDILSQVDEQPQRGERATSSWVEGEVIADPHGLTLSPPSNDGAPSYISYMLRIGLYMPMTGTTMTVDGARELTLEINIPER